MANEKREYVAGYRKYYEDEIEAMIRLMKIEGGSLDDCIAELNLLADFVRSQTDGLKDVWPTLLKDTYYEEWERNKNEADAANEGAEPK
jgi:hypothetical protein